METFEKVNVEQKLALFSDHWNPRIVGEGVKWTAR
jgi:hypothetical protein